MSRVIYLISLICIFLIYNIRYKLKLYYIQYNPKILKIKGPLVNSNYENELYNKNSDILFLVKVSTLINNSNFVYLYQNYIKYPDLIHPIKFDYTHDLTVNDNKKNGNHVIITYPNIPNITFIENIIYSINIIEIINQIIKYTNITKNDILFLDYFIHTDTNKLYIKQLNKNKTKCDATIFNLISLIKLIIINKSLVHSKKQLYVIIGEISSLINTMNISVLDQNLEKLYNENIFNKKKSNKLKNFFNKKESNKLKNIKITYKITGLDITNKKINEIKQIIAEKPDIPEINNTFIKNNFIGQGIFSNVYRNGDKIIKIIKQEHMYSKEYNEEIKASSKINNIKDASDYFPKYYRSFLSKVGGNISICLEYDYIQGQTALDFIRQKKNIGNTSITKIINNIILGNKFLNKNGILRTDNHSSNIMILTNHQIKYIDFGRTFIINNSKNHQLDTNKYFKTLIQIALIILQTSLTKKKDLLNTIFTEFLSALSNVHNSK